MNKRGLSSPSGTRTASVIPLPCRGCRGGGSLHLLHSFGKLPVAGYLETTTALARRAPKFENAVAICGICGLVQQADLSCESFMVEKVYRFYQATYSMSQKVRSYMDAFLDLAAQVSHLKRGDTVIEIGSNDGSVLDLIQARGQRAIGFDPSANVSARGGHKIIQDFFSATTARRFVEDNGTVKLVMSRHTLEHTFDPLDFLMGVEIALDKNGRAVIEVPYLHFQMINNQFQSMTFQHVLFFTVTSIVRLFHRAKLELLDIRFSEMDAGSMILIVGKTSSRGRDSQNIKTILSQESVLDLARVSGYREFFDKVGRQKDTARTFFQTLARRRIRAVGYGAGAKGQALLNMLALDSRILPFVIDDTPGYAGRFVPGVGSQVIKSRDPRAKKADVILITAPSHVQEILGKERTKIAKGIRFMSTVPDLHFVSESLP